jgi:hypothetical protein
MAEFTLTPLWLLSFEQRSDGTIRQQAVALTAILCKIGIELGLTRVRNPPGGQNSTQPQHESPLSAGFLGEASLFVESLSV